MFSHWHFLSNVFIELWLFQLFLQRNLSLLAIVTIYIHSLKILPERVVVLWAIQLVNLDFLKLAFNWKLVPLVFIDVYKHFCNLISLFFIVFWEIRWCRS